MKNIFSKIFIFLTASLLFVGCDDFFNPDSEDTLYEDDYVGSYTEMFSGFLGIYSAVQDVADKPAIFEGLRSLWLEPTANAPMEFWDVYNFKDDLTGNELVDPTGFYKIVVAANDYIEHAFDYRERNPTALDEATFKGLVGGALRYKAWAYLNLAKFYGKAVYFDDPLASLEDIKQFPYWDFDQIINKCIDLIVTGTNGIDGKTDIVLTNELFPDGSGETDANSWWNRICPSADILLQELYLWKQDYHQSWQHGLNILYTNPTGNNRWFLLAAHHNGNKWLDIFKGYLLRVHIFWVDYDYDKGQTNNLKYYLNNLSPNVYYAKPTWKQIELHNDAGSGPRGSRSYTVQNGDTISIKFFSGSGSGDTYYAQEDQAYRHDTPIPLYRDSDVFLMMAEALTSMGRYKEALAFLNGGFNNYYNFMIGIYQSPFNVGYPDELATTGSGSFEVPSYGVRGRVSADSRGDELLYSANIDDNVDRWYLDSIVTAEYFLEFNGEGKAVPAAIRMMRRWGDAETAETWADIIASKYHTGGAAVRQKLTDINNWFIPYDIFQE